MTTTHNLLDQRWTVAYALAAWLIATAAWGQTAPATGQAWISLFNGHDLTGWTPKIKGYELGENFGNTFRVEDGVLKVSYDHYTQFNRKFGHIFYKDKFSHYRLRIEYRFVGEQCPGGEGWATRNSGVMLHCQPPNTIAKDQDFPVSIEVQFLGGLGKGPRSTGNLCTPGTHVVMGGELIKRHCTNSRSPTLDGDQWVTSSTSSTARKCWRMSSPNTTTATPPPARSSRMARHASWTATSRSNPRAIPLSFARWKFCL
jgi:Domain of Unknown Function (DUF1080)